MTRTRNDCSSRAIRREIEREDNYQGRVLTMLKHLAEHGTSELWKPRERQRVRVLAR